MADEQFEYLAMLRQGSDIWNRWKKENPHFHANLSGNDLRGADLSRMDLNNDVLSYSNLSGANLSYSNLYWADLVECDLTGANLSGVDLSWANLYNANLTGADLNRANLSFAKLENTNLTRVELIETVFADVDLSTAIGLETVRHSGPSPVSVDTIFQSRGRIPDVFLRGAGVPEELITYLPALLGQPIQYYSCFISYNHADRAFARRLHDALQGEGIRCWLDEKQVLPGHDIYEEVDRGIRLWDKVLVCCSSNSLTSWWVDAEIARALAKEQQLTKERGHKVRALIPLNLDGYLFSGWESGFASEVKRRLAADFTGW